MIARRRSIFVGGPIQYAVTGGGAFDLRLRSVIAKSILTLESAGFEVLSAHIAEHFGLQLEDSPTLVTTRDFQWSTRCDLYVAILPMIGTTPFRTDGTHIELGWIAAQHKPIIIIWDDAGAENYSHLVRGLHTVCPVRYMHIADVATRPQLICEQVAVMLN